MYVYTYAGIFMCVWYMHIAVCINIFVYLIYEHATFLSNLCNPKYFVAIKKVRVILEHGKWKIILYGFLYEIIN